jgi:hypothetical protein
LPWALSPRNLAPFGWCNIFTCYLVCNFSSHLVNNFFHYFIHKHILLCFKKCLINIFSPLSLMASLGGSKGVVTFITSKFHTSLLMTISSTLNLMKTLYFLMN